MAIFISHLIDTENMRQIFDSHELGIEIVQFGSAASLDDKEKYMDEYEDELGKIGNVKEISFHGPYVDLVPASRDPKIRRVTKDRLECAYDIANIYNSKHIVYHSGYMPKTYGSDEWIENSALFWSEFIESRLNENDMQIHIENVYDEDYMLLSDLVDRVNHPNFSICLDIGHASLCSSISLEQWIKGLNKRIKHVHLHNNYGIQDDHNGLLNGTIDIKNVLDLLKTYACGSSLALEIMDAGQLKVSIDFLKSCDYLSALNHSKS